MACSMDSLKFSSSWSGGISGAQCSVKLGGIQLEGCTFDGTRLAENQQDSAIISTVPNCHVAWVPKVFCENTNAYTKSKYMYK